MLYNNDDVNKFYELMSKEQGKKQNLGALGKLAAMFKPVVTRYSELLEEQRLTYRDYIRGFKNTSALSEEFIWKCKNLQIENLTIEESEYPFFEVAGAKISDLNQKSSL